MNFQSGPSLPHNASDQTEPRDGRSLKAAPASCTKLEIQGSKLHQPRQTQFWADREILQRSLVARLNRIGELKLATKMDACHTIETFRQCRGCNSVSHFWNRCDLMLCPQCQPRLARKRQQEIKWWAAQVRAPKHVVLTIANQPILLADHFKTFVKCLARLRRSKLARNWAGGCYTLEVTNEGRGWHLHAHLLVDSHWIDSGDLARRWAEIVGQDFSIVKVKAVGSSDYLHEVSKYVVKPAQMAGWSDADLSIFIRAIQGRRTFGVWGNLRGRKAEWKLWRESQEEHARTCPCGSNNFKHYSRAEWEAEEALQRPPPSRPLRVAALEPCPQLDLFAPPIQWPR